MQPRAAPTGTVHCVPLARARETRAIIGLINEDEVETFARRLFPLCLAIHPADNKSRLNIRNVTASAF